MQENIMMKNLVGIWWARNSGHYYNCEHQDSNNVHRKKKNYKVKIGLQWFKKKNKKPWRYQLDWVGWRDHDES